MPLLAEEPEQLVIQLTEARADELCNRFKRLQGQARRWRAHYPSCL